MLVEGDDFNEPICDAVRSILDGHIVLSRRLADMGHYPAIDVLGSVSRLAPRITAELQRRDAQKLREALAAYARVEDLIHLGVYVSGANPQLDNIIAHMPAIREFLRQDTARERALLEETLSRMQQITQKLSA